MTDKFETDWQKVAKTENEEKVFSALDNPKWEWRTVDGLSKETGVEPENIRTILNKHTLLVRRSIIADTGEEIYTLQQRYLERKAPAENVWDFMSSSSSSSS